MAITALRIDEGCVERIFGTIQDRNGDVVPGTSLLSATLSLFDVETYDPDGSPISGIINGRDHQDVLGTASPVNNVQIYDALQTAADGTTYSFYWDSQAADHQIQNGRRQIERHRATFTFAWSGGRRVVEFEIDVRNLGGEP